MASYKVHKWLMEGEILMYIRSSATTDIWQVRFRNPMSESPRYIRKSTKHKSEALATAAAVELFNQYRSRSLLNLKTEKTTIGYLLETYAHQFDGVTLKTMRGFNRGYWQRYIGDDDVSVYTSEDIENYFKWRIKDKTKRQAKADDDDGNDQYWNSSESTISASTLKLERNMMRRLFQVGYKFNYIARIPSFPRRFDRMPGVHKLPSNKRRGRFRPVEDYQQIVLPYLNEIRNGMTSPKWAPQLQNINKPFHEVNNIWESRLKDKNRNDKKRITHPVYCHRNARWTHAHFWFASLLIANSGIRPGACHRLRHRDINLVPDEDGKVYTLITIDEEISKTGNSRVVVCRDFHKTYERYLLFRREIQFRFNRHLKDDDYIFPSTHRATLYDYPRAKADAVFRGHFKRMGLHTRSQEVKLADGSTEHVKVFFSAYSYRSFYITERLKNGLDLYTLSKNVGSSPKTILNAYDFNENWEFRKKITQHYKAEPSSDCPETLEAYFSPSHLFV